MNRGASDEDDCNAGDIDDNEEIGPNRVPVEN
jgi:hypothetical protein